jgi:PAS domain S-box-containing protein
MTRQKQAETSQRSEPLAPPADGPLIPLVVLEQTVETGHLGFATLDVSSGTFLAANSRFCAMVGFSFDELIGIRLPLKELTHPDDFERCACEFRKLIRGEVESYVIEKRLIRRDRSVLPVRVTATALTRSPEDRTVLTVGFISAPAASGFAGSPPRAPVAPQGASFWTHEFSSRTSNCSDSFKVLLGRPVDGPLPSFRECIAQVHLEDRMRVMDDVRRVTKGLVHSSEFRIFRLNGELRWVSQTVTPVVDSVGEVVGAVAGCLDITDAKRFARQTPAANTVRAVKQHVDLHWDQPLSVTDLAQVANVNARTLFKHFKQGCGSTPQEYIKRVRLNHARALLQMADKSTTVLGIALKCCFQNQGHFARDYRLAFGERPSDTLARARRLVVEI